MNDQLEYKCEGYVISPPNLRIKIYQIPEDIKQVLLVVAVLLKLLASGPIDVWIVQV